MKGQIIKKLSAFIVTAMMFSVNLNAQSQTGNVQSPPPDGPNSIVVGCNCKKAGYGCGGQLYCTMYCAHMCHLHLVQVGNSNSNLSDGTALNGSNATVFSFFIDQPEKVSLRVFDLNGRLVKTIANKAYETGEHSLSWNSNDEKGNKIAAGVYALKTDAGEETERQKIIVQ